MWMLGANFVAVIVGGVARSIFGEGFGELIYNTVMTLSGVILLFAPGAPPVLLPIAIVMAASPTVWWFLSSTLMANTEYVRMMQGAAADDLPPRIIE
jgi:hypothetical protein